MDHARVAMINHTNRIPENFIIHDETREDLTPGIYMALHHGRTDPEQDMDDWGFDAHSIIGPIRNIGHTYNCTVRVFIGEYGENDIWLSDAVDKDELHFVKPNVIALHQDMLYLNGAFYGDWTFFSA